MKRIRAEILTRIDGHNGTRYISLRYDFVRVKNRLSALVLYHYSFDVLFQLLMIEESMKMTCLCLELDVKWIVKYLVYLLATLMKLKKMFRCKRCHCFQNILRKRASKKVVET